jgi:hypothetical protein
MSNSGAGAGAGDVIDTNVNNYTVHELLDLIGLGGLSEIRENEFSHIIHNLVVKYREVDVELSRFFTDVGRRLYEWLNIEDRVIPHDNDNDNDNDHKEGLAMRSSLNRGGNNRGTGGTGDGKDVGGGGEDAGGEGYDDNMGGVGGGDYGEDDDGGNDDRVDPNDIMGLKRDSKRGLVTGDQQLKWERNQYLDDDGSLGNGAYVNRNNKAKIFRDENGHYQMKRKKVGIANSYSVPIAQGTTNPILRNTMSRIINIDSQFRQTAFPYTLDPTSPTSATSFTVVLSEPLTNVTSLKLNSINIPYTWYTVDSAIGNNVMYIDMNTGVNGVHTITVPNGNYVPSTLVGAVRRQISLNSYLSGNIDISYNVINGLCFLFNYTQKTIGFTFYDAASIYAGKAAATAAAAGGGGGGGGVGTCRQSTKLNSSLGWLLGFRNSNYYDGVPMLGGNLPTGYNTSLNTFNVYGMVYMVLGVTDNMVVAATTGEKISLVDQISNFVTGIYSDGNTSNDASSGNGWLRGEGIVDCYGPQYFLLIIDDFNHSRVNSGVVGISEITTSLARPTYYNTDLPSMCLPDTTDVTNGLTKKTLYVPSVPRTLTFSQLYTLNEITANRSGGGAGGSGKNREMGPKTSDVFALIPLRGTAALTIGQHYIDSGVGLLTNQRAYFGPVVINKLRITLRDDKGYVVNLHGNDWSFSLVTEELYEF